MCAELRKHLPGYNNFSTLNLTQQQNPLKAAEIISFKALIK